MHRETFNCSKCGLCCQNLNRSHLYDDLNDGTGVCVYYDKNTQLCSIYYNRPEKCNVEKSYKYFAEKYTYNEYLKLNYQSCYVLKGVKR